MGKYKKVSGILDEMISFNNGNVWPCRVFYISHYDYNRLCKELGRKVKTYKKHKVMARAYIKREHAYLTSQHWPEYKTVNPIFHL